MDHSLTTYICLALILSAAAILQAAVGFGFALFALPLMLYLGIDLPICITISLFIQFWQQGINTYHMREEIVFKPLIPLICSAWVFIVIGVLLQNKMMLLERSTIRQIIGAIVMAVVIIDWAWKIKHRDRLHPFWAILAGSIGGLLSGLAGIPGPPIVVWVMSHTWSNKRSRVSLWVIFLSLLPCLFIILLLNYGSIILDALLPALCLTPLVVICSFFGVKIGNKLKKEKLRKIAMIILMIMALLAMLKF